MEVSSEPSNLSQSSHDQADLPFKFECKNPNLDFSIDYFDELPYEMKTSRLFFDCGNPGINYFVHRGLWPMTERRKLISVTVNSIEGMHAVMSYAAAPIYPKDLKTKLGSNGKDKIIFLKYLGVDIKYQGQEMGSMLLHMLIELGEEMFEKDNTYKYIVVEAPTKKACDFYESHGFLKVGMNINGDTQYKYPLGKIYN